MMVFVFLQNWRATLIPIVAVPVSLIGTFARMYLLGFSINTLTLFGMVLAIGIVVDDAIVVLKNVERIIVGGAAMPREAAIKAMQDVSGPVIAIVLVLCAVFIPVAFLGGIAGQLYQQFAITIAVSVVISGIVALALTPALCAVLLKSQQREPGRVFRWFNRAFDRTTSGYTGAVGFLIRRSLLSLAIFAVIIAGALILFRVLPTSFIPAEEQGLLHYRSDHAGWHRPQPHRCRYIAGVGNRAFQPRRSGCHQHHRVRPPGRRAKDFEGVVLALIRRRYQGWEPRGDSSFMRRTGAKATARAWRRSPNN